jgi:DNA replication factor GINS
MVRFTLDDIKATWAKEKASRELIELPDEFYSNVARYVAELNRELGRGEELRRELLQEELRNVLRMVQEIHLSRTFKALGEISEGRLPSSLLDRERYAFGEIRQILEKLHTQLVTPALRGEVAITAPPEATHVPLVVLAEIPQIMGDDMRQYGPFKSGEIASLPRRSAELLIKHDLARKVEVKAL